MKLAIICFTITIIVAVSARPDDDDEKYTTKFDNVDFEAVLKSDRMLRNYIDCLLDKKPCTKEGEALKEFLPEALKTKCAKCSDAQKEGAKKVMDYLLKNKKDWWGELEAVYDKDGSLKKMYEKELKEHEAED